MSEKIFAFDVGTGSLGIAVREGNEIIDARSYIIPPEFASIKEQRNRRRQNRTRKSHKKREEWLKQECRKAGIEVLEGRIPGNKKKRIEPREGEERLEREFAQPGDKTVYTSCLLRILLLRGEHLEGWQVYKALHSAIQRRGYDPDVPWKRKSTKRKKEETQENAPEQNNTESEDKEEKENLKKSQEYENKLREITSGREERMYPCYYDAYRMGLWDNKTDSLFFTQTHKAQRARSGELSPSRRFVEKEVRGLLIASSKLFPALKDRINCIMYGPAGESYASHCPELRKRFNMKEGGDTDWQGILSQKVPRFDNRMPDRCALIPRYNVCRADDHLAMQFTFLMKLKNMRYFDSEHRECMLTAGDIRLIFEEKRAQAIKVKNENKHPQKIAGKYKFTPKQWTNWLEKHRCGYPKPNHETVDPPKVTGRKRYSRPAMRIMRDLILSGESPWKFYNRKLEEIDNDDSKKGLVSEDIEFLLKLPDNWEGIYIPQYSLAEQFLEGKTTRDMAIQTLINKQRNPIIRHRMELFKRYLDILTETHGIPDKVVIELVRQDFKGPKEKSRFEKWQRENRKKAEDARKEAEELGVSGYKNRLKLRLLKQQHYQCLYTGENLSSCDLSELDVDHAVPQRGRYNGSDSMYNKVVTKAATNRGKSDLTPYEFITAGEKWQAYCERIKNLLPSLGKKKVALLTSETPQELDEKYTQLAETAWIARIARNIVCLYFGWQLGEKGEHEKAPVVDGKLTANVRRRYDINKLLADPDEKDPEKIERKNRDDDRHHALDAMVLSFITRNKPELPKDVHKERFREWIERVIPEQIAFEKPELEQTIYAKRNLKVGNEIKQSIVKRVSLLELGFERSNYSLQKVRKNALKIVDSKIRAQIERFLETEPDKDEWKAFVEYLKQSEKGGSNVVRVALNIGDPNEYKDLGKNDGRGQYRKANKHWGQYLYINEKGKAKVRPVYAFESKRKVRTELREKGFKIVDFFEAGCLVELENDLDLENRVIPAGKYRLGSLRTDGFVKLESTISELKNPVGIERLLSRGFRRVR